MRHAIAFALAVTTAACTAQAPTQPAGSAPPAAPAAPATLQSMLDAELPKIPAKAGIWVKHLTTGEEGAVNADETFNSASVIKIPVAVQALEMVDAGTKDLATRITLRAEDARTCVPTNAGSKQAPLL